LQYHQRTLRVRRFAMAAWGVVACFASQVLAQGLPIDAGRIQEQLRTPEPPRKPAAPAIRIEPPAGEAKADSPPFQVGSFRVTGATVFPTENLERLLGEAGRPMTLSEVQERAERITKAYKDKGYVVARAFVPAQDVRDGVVEIRVVEGRYERIDISNASDMSEGRIREILGNVRENAIVHGPTLERAVLLISDLAGVQPKATLEPGAQAGFTNLALEIVPTKTVDYDVTVDNAGSTFTGKNRITLGLTINSPGDIGDRAAARVITSGRGLTSARLSYDRPLGASGLRASGYLSNTTYELGEQFAELQASGTARAWGLGFVYPLVRAAEFNLRLIANGEYRELEDRIAANDIINEKSAHALQWGASVDLRDAFFGGGLTVAQALMSNGNLRIHGGQQLITDDAATTRTQGGYKKLSLLVNRLQAITEDLRLVLNYTGQLAADNLDSYEKFSLGGISGVRAYPAGEAAGDDVHLFQAEARINAGQFLGGQMVPSAFIDMGTSRINHQPWTGFTGVNYRKLAGAGLGLEWSRPGSMFVRAWYAHKIGNEPALADADRPSRVWVQGGVLF
jgi:hemolysin activation/secretion protein